MRRLLQYIMAEIVVPFGIVAIVLGLIFGTIRGIMYVVSHLWLGISL